MRGATWLKRLFIPRGNLLVADIVGEVTIHIMSSGEFKAIVSKFDDGPEQKIAQSLIQALLNTTVGIAKERGITIWWDALKQAHPPFPGHRQ